MDYVYVNSTIDNPNQASWENALLTFNTSLVNTIGSLGASQFASCMDEMLSLVCFNVFPVCDYSSSAVSRPRQVHNIIYTLSVCVCVCHMHMYVNADICVCTYILCLQVCVCMWH